ncbi:MAG: beta-N-acetylhexosaminidase [Oscillospiraceae bacterium]|nr:beta-N-acetylhexosaminidase [Oscillospiraceae bacterium]
MGREIKFRRFGTMLDCSRNAVYTVQSVKKWVDLTSDLGYNTLMLFTADTYELDGHPYCGYLRGRYSNEEFKEISAYCDAKGMELIPCIQTLGHLEMLLRWPPYAPYADTDDTLLVEDERTYDLLDRMFAWAAEIFTSRTIMINLDEAYMLGRGKYYDLHGPANRFQLLMDHLHRLDKIAKKHGFTKMVMSADMFFKLASGEYYNWNAEIPQDAIDQLPEDVELCYWDYHMPEIERYDGMIKRHQDMKRSLWFWGASWTWKRFAPKYHLSMMATQASLGRCLVHNVPDFLVSMWGDDGGECSFFATLPLVFQASELARGNTDLKDIKARFEKKYGIPFDRFLLLGMPDGPGYDQDYTNPDRYLLFNDCFLGAMDSTIAGGENEQYAKCARRLSRVKKDGEWGYLFENIQALCEVLAIKAELGVKTREVYQSKDQQALLALIGDYKKVLKKLDVFHRTLRKQWFMEKKPHGFDVQDIRLGGLSARIRSCMERLQDLYDGKITVIEELEEKTLDVLGNGEELGRKPIWWYKDWKRNATSNYI